MSLTDASWREQAACVSTPTHLFFPDDDSHAAAAKTVCRTCPSRVPCLAFAFASGDYEAVLGGTTGNERRRMRRNRRRVA